MEVFSALVILVEDGAVDICSGFTHLLIGVSPLFN
jgi:hypothetical protein